MGDLDRQNELDIVQIRGDLRLIAQKVEAIKNNDLHHIQKSIDNITRILWAVGFLILGQIAVAIKSLLVGG
jgi:hypothetical protein|tara:strand:+ start:1204 stop:1416 length:213 start_codon:yes stop_codon:yes gene_type:complete